MKARKTGMGRQHAGFRARSSVTSPVARHLRPSPDAKRRDEPHLGPAPQDNGGRPQPRLQRSIMERINLIHAAIKAVAPGSTRRVTRASLARELEVSDSTIKRDLEALVHHYQAPLEFDFGRCTYRYADPYFELRAPIWLSPVEAGAVMLAVRSCSSRAFPFGPGLRAAVDKIAPSLGGAVSFRDGMTALDAVVSVPGEPPTEVECRHFELLREAAMCRRVVRISYMKTSPGARPESRLIHPLHLAVLPEGCIVVAHAPEAGDRRNFDLARISHAEATGDIFETPAGFNLAKYLAGGLDRFLGEPRHEVKIRFHGSYLAYVRMHRWHPDQTFTELPDGSAESVFHVHHLLEMVYFVLAAAGDAEVVSPPELGTMVRAAAEKLVSRHPNPTTKGGGTKP